MVNGRIPSVYSKTYVTPRRPYEKARLDQELKIIGEYGLRNKREVWRVKYTLAKIRKAARELLTLEEKDQKRLFEGLYYKFIQVNLGFVKYYDETNYIWHLSSEISDCVAILKLTEYNNSVKSYVLNLMYCI